MSAIATIEKRIAEARKLFDDAVARLAGSKGLADAKAAAIDRMAAEAVISNLEADLVAAGADAELQRLRVARKGRIAAAAEGQALKLKSAAAVKDGLADALVEALDAAHAGIDALDRVGVPVDLEMPIGRGALTSLKAEILRRAAALEADAKRPSEDVEADLEARAWSVVRQARNALGSKLPPHQTRLWLNDETATGSLEIFIREGVEWRGNGGDEACDRALALHLLDGWTLDPTDDDDLDEVAA